MNKKPGVADNKSYKDMYHFNDNFYKKNDKDKFPSINVDPDINTTIKENPYRSNVEIEKDEIVLNPDLSALFKANGKKHSGGGIDVMLAPDSFVFSDDKSLAFTERDHKMFEFKKGGNFKPNKNTPAEVLKRNVDLKHYNTLVSNIGDIKKDDLAKKSSAMMLEKYIATLGQIATVQEGKKDFPTGIPDFAIGTAPVYNAEVKDEVLEQKQYAKYGGAITNPYMKGGGFVVDDTDPYLKSRTPEGRRTPTGKSSLYNKDKQYLNRWEAKIPGISQLSNEEAQKLIYAHTLNSNPQKVIDMWKTYGITNKGKKDSQLMDLTNNGVFIPEKLNEHSLKDLSLAYVDGMFGARQLEPDEIIKKDPPPRPVVKITNPGTEPGTPPAEPVVPSVSGPTDQGRQIDWQFSPWQKVSQLYNASKYAGAKRYMPYRSQINPAFIDPSLVNPEQAVGDAQAAAAQSLRALGTMNPILRNAQAATSYGQFMNQVPGIRSQYDNQNAGILNQTRAQNTQITNTARAQNMQNDQKYYQESIVGQQNFDNLKTFLADNYMNNVMGDVQDNQSLAYNLATMKNPAYGYDFRSGNFYRNPKNILDVESNGMGDVFEQRLKEIEQNTSLTPSEKEKLKNQIIISKKFTTSTAKKGGKIGINPYK